MKPMGQGLDKSNNCLRHLLHDQRGVTGLETAIILIAFVVVASVFAFTVLSTGIFAAERSRETVFAGLQQARGTIELKGSVTARGVPDVTISNAESPWSSVPDVAAIADSNNRKQGNYSASLTIQTPFLTGLAAYENLSPSLDLSSTDSVHVWVRASKATSQGDLQLRLSPTPGCTGVAEDLDLPALSASSWQLATLGINDGTARDSIACVGLVVATDLSTTQSEIVNLDQIFGPGQATEIVMTLANSIDGEPIDLSAPSDSDGDGLADSEDRGHKLIVTYADSHQVFNDLFWQSSFVGANDGDDLLETGEKVDLTVSLEALYQRWPLTESREFTIEVKPAEGAALPIVRSMPGQIDDVMNLN